MHETRQRDTRSGTRADARAAAADVAHGALVATRAVVNVARQRQAAPEYVTFVLDGAYPELPAAQRAWQRRLFPQKATLDDLRHQVDVVAGDGRVRGAVLHLRSLDMPMARLEALREIVGRLRRHGKHVVTWSARYDTASTYVAAAADEVLLQPGGEIAPLGLQATYAFLADSLERLGLRFDSVAISPYKSAADLLTRTEMSDEVREMATWLLDANYDELVSAIAAGRGLDHSGARALIDGAPYTDQAALAAGAVDGLVAEEALPDWLGRRDGDGGARLSAYAKAHRTLLLPRAMRPGRSVGLLRIEGTIVDGESSRPPAQPPFSLPLVGEARVGDLTVVRQARALAEDESTAAVVVYIASPGGSATASEAIASALGRLAERKPIVAAMGPVAASGGYYVATPARWIVAQPGTLTGSIGVLSGKLVGSELLDRLLVHRERLQRGRNVAMYGAESTFDDEQRQRVEESIRRIYDVFVARVADSRSMSEADVHAVGAGRVWTGRQALARGLVDEMGDITAAADRARAEAGLSPRAPIREVFPPKQPIAPIADPTALLRYAAETGRLLQRANALVLWPLDWRLELA